MNIKPILYSMPMVQAIQENRKTRTRRTKGLEKLKDHYFQSLVHHATGKFTFVKNGNFNPSSEDIIEIKCPYGEVGDILWVRENFYTASNWDHWKPSGLQLVNAEVFYQADLSNYDIVRPVSRGKMRPNIFLPFFYARIFLQIKSVTVERLQDVTEADAIAEGIKYDEQFKKYTCYLCENKGHEGVVAMCDDGFFSNPIDSFRTLWKSINGQSSWHQNPWVWVIEFEKVQKPQNFI
jgi:hypothetical protein